MKQADNKPKKDVPDQVKIDTKTKMKFPMDELKTLFDLYQTGALTRIEYEQCKKYLLERIS